MKQEIDILEDYIQQLSHDMLEILLVDHTTSTPDKRNYIFWGTSDYEFLGNGYSYHDPILPELITGANGSVIMPRIIKSQERQLARSRDMAEVFTPAWVCNKQNNLIDTAWFGRENVFNQEVDSEIGGRRWRSIPEKIAFPEGKSWRDYVLNRRMEMACGEAPYLVSRYDTASGAPIPLDERIGILDRKMRVISENTVTSRDWLRSAQDAYKSTYAFEWQGDNLLLAREAMLYTFIENYYAKFGRMPQVKSMRYIAYIISWNVWQMDGLKGVVPGSCVDMEYTERDLFGHEVKTTIPCKGCKEEDITAHNGVYCLIKDWRAYDSQTKTMGKKVRFVDILSSTSL